MSSVLIIGYGNPLRRDDGVGWRAATQLAEIMAAADVQIIACHQLTPELAEPLSAARFALFIDAFAGPGAQPGEIVCRAAAPRAVPDGGYIHDCDPAGLLAMARAWHGRAPEAMILGIGAESLEWGEEFSEPVARAYPALLRRAREIMEEALRGAALQSPTRPCR